MAVKSVVEIDIEDAKFKRFAETFSKYQDALKKSPEVWKNINKASAHTQDTFMGISAALLSINALHKEENEATRKGTQTLERHSSLWTKIHRSTTGVLKDVGGIAKFLIGGGVALGLGGLGLGLAGLFGLRGMANKVSGERNLALGTASQIGQWQAFHTFQARNLPGAESIFSHAATVGTPGSPASVLSDVFGFSTGGGTYATANRELQAVRDRVRGMSPANAGLFWMKYGSLLGNAGFTQQGIMALSQLPKGELHEEIRKGTAAIPGLTLNAEQGKKFQDFQSRLNTIFATIGTSLEKSVMPLLGPIKGLVGAFGRDVNLLVSSGVAKSAIGDLAAGLNNLATYLASGKFTKAIQDFGNDVKGFEEAMHVTKKIGSVASWPFRKAAKGWWDIGEALGKGTHNLVQYGISTYENAVYQAQLNAIAAHAGPLKQGIPTAHTSVSVHTHHVVTVHNATGSNISASVNQLRGGTN